MLSCIPCTPCVCGIFLCVEQIDGGSKIFYDNLCRNRLGLILGFQLGASSVCGQPTHLGWRRRPYIFCTSNFLLLREFSCGFEGGYNYKTFSGKFHRNVFSLLHDDFSWYAFVCNSDYMFCRIVHKIFQDASCLACGKLLTDQIAFLLNLLDCQTYHTFTFSQSTRKTQLLLSCNSTDMPKHALQKWKVIFNQFNHLFSGTDLPEPQDSQVWWKWKWKYQIQLSLGPRVVASPNVFASKEISLQLKKPISSGASGTVPLIIWCQACTSPLSTSTP